MKRIFSLLFAFCSFTLGWSECDLSTSFISGQIWDLDRPNFFDQYMVGERFTWSDSAKTEIRIPKPTLKFGAIPVGETLLKSKDETPGNLESIQIMVYNKGDDGPISEEEFNKLAELAKAELSTMTGAKMQPYKLNRQETAVKTQGFSWESEKGVAMLEVSSSKSNKQFEAEFIRLKLGKNKEVLARKANEDGTAKADLKNHVKREGADKAEIEGIPMVDQGQKGYCVVATAARVFAYYGKNYIDQHELASVADSSGTNGTSVVAMVEALKKIGVRFQVRVKEQDLLSTTKDYERLVKDYNKVAKKLKKPLLNASDYGKIWDVADGEIMKKARCSSPAQMDRWMRPVKQYIDMGIPILWSVHLGLVPEPVILNQTRGGHMRLITGYDMTNKKLIFSDSWGMPHMRKEMPIEDAMAIANGRVLILPTR